MSLSVAIMAHPKRKRMVDKLVAKLDAKPQVVWDEKNSVWDTGRRALLAHLGLGATHALVLQDDAKIGDGLIEACEKLLTHVPSGHPVTLYMGRWRHRPRRFNMAPVVQAAQKHGASFAVFGGPWWGPAIILPTADIEAIVDYGDRNPRKHSNYDIRIAQYYDDKGVPCYYSMPSLVDHHAGQSIIGRRGSRRHAEWAWDGPYDQLDWSDRIVTPKDMTFKGRFPRTP